MVKCRLAIPVGLSEALVGIYEVRLQLQSLLECLYSFLRTGKSFESAFPFLCYKGHWDKATCLYNVESQSVR